MFSYRISPTRYQDADAKIYFGKSPSGDWRFVVDNDGLAQVGPTFKTKAELLAYLPEYAKQWGFK